MAKYQYPNETMSIESHNKIEVFPPGLEQAYKKSESELENSRIDMRDFSDLYGSEVIRKDEEKVERLKANFELDANKKFSIILEAITLDMAKKHQMFSARGEVACPTEFDDIVNKVDLIVAIREENSDAMATYLALGIDVTFGKAAAEKKIEDVKNEIANGELGTVKYFQSESHGFKGQLENVPRAIVGIEKQSVAELVGPWMKDDEEKLSKHPVHRAIIEQLTTQLSVLRRFAEFHGQEQAAEAYKRAASTIRKIRERKLHINLDELEHDRVHNEIIGYMKELDEFMKSKKNKA